MFDCLTAIYLGAPFAANDPLSDLEYGLWRMTLRHMALNFQLLPPCLLHHFWEVQWPRPLLVSAPNDKKNNHILKIQCPNSPENPFPLLPLFFVVCYIIGIAGLHIISPSMCKQEESQSRQTTPCPHACDLPCEFLPTLHYKPHKYVLQMQS